MPDPKSKNRGITLACVMLATGTTAALPAIASPEAKLRGRIHMDAAFHDDDQVPLGDGVLNRRARMGIKGRIDSDWSFQIEADFAENDIDAKDVKLMYSLDGAKISLGHFKVPMGLSELTSSNDMPFIERASNSNLVVDSRRLGIGYARFADKLGFQTMVYSRELDESAPETAPEEQDNPLGIAGRVVFNPVKNEARMVHLGLSAAYEDRADFQALRFRDRPEARPAGVRLIDTGTIANVDDTLKYGVELAYQAGPFSAEAEYLQAKVNRDTGSEPDFGGFHVQGSWVLTGESRDYKKGTFGGVKPGGTRGAWEVAARYSSADLNDSGFDGGEQDNLTLGLNYYANANVRFMANYILVDIEDSGATANDVVVGNDSPNILLLRAQVNW